MAHGANGDEAIRRLEDHVMGRHPGQFGRIAHVCQRCHALGPEIRDHRVQHGDANMLALARAFTMQQRGRHRLCGIDGGCLVGDEGAHHAWTPDDRVTLDVGQPGTCLDHRIIYALGNAGPRFTGPAYGQVGDTGVALKSTRRCELFVNRPERPDSARGWELG